MVRKGADCGVGAEPTPRGYTVRKCAGLRRGWAWCAGTAARALQERGYFINSAMGRGWAM
jgi:hypothetical protein